MDVKSIISQMTLEEKAALCSGKDFWHLDTPQRLGIESVMVSDGPCGIRKQSDAADHLGLNASVPATSYPTGSCMAVSYTHLCASLLFALTGAAPMEAPKRKQDPRLMISKNILKQLPEQVIPAIANGLQVEPSRRTSSFSRFSAELAAEPTVVEKFVETETVRSLPSGSGRTPSKRRVPAFLWLVASFVFTPVSYTHLDVYKRQKTPCRCWSACPVTFRG